MPAPSQSPATADPKNPKQTADLLIDITAYLCPMTFVRTRLALDRLHGGQILAVRLKGEEPLLNIPHTAREQGHQVLETIHHGDGTTTILVRKAGAPGPSP